MSAILRSHPAFWLLLALPGLAMATAFARDPATAAFDLVHPSGEMSVRLMIAAMAVSPLLALFGRRRWLQWLLARRRALGVAAFAYAALHLAFYLVDMGALDGDWRGVLGEAALPSILTGYIALAIFAAMAATSNRSGERLLGRRWKTLQRTVYAVAVLLLLHWIWVDNDWRGAFLHLAPLAILEMARLVVLFNRGSARRCMVAR